MSAVIPAAPTTRPRVLLVGTALAAVASAMVVATLFGIYISRRADALANGETWFPNGASLPLTAPNMMMMTLSLSVVTMAWAIWSAHDDNRTATLLGLLVTGMFGVSIVNQTSFIYKSFNVAMDEPSGVGVLFYAVTGSYMAMVIISVLFMAMVAIRVAVGQYREVPDGVTAAGIYWFVTVGVYVVLWLGVYIAK